MHYVRLLILLLISVTLAVTTAAAATGEDIPPEPTLSLSELIDKAVKNNPRVRAARLRWEAVKERHAQATALDDPMLIYTQPIKEVETRLGPQERMVALSQKFPFPGKLAVLGDIAKKEADIAHAGYEKVLRDVAAEVKVVFHELRYIERAIEITEEDKAVLEYFKKVSTTNYNLNLSGLDELVRAQRLYAAASFELIRLEDLKEETTAKLNILIDRTPSHPLPPLEGLEYTLFTHSLDELFELATKNYDHLKISWLKVERSELKRQLTSYDYLPDFRLGLNYSAIGTPETQVAGGGDDAMAVSFGLTIPLWRGKYKAAGSEALKEREEAVVLMAAATKELSNLTVRLYSRLLNSEKILKLYEESFIPEAEGSIKFAEVRYKSGEETLPKLLETQSMRLRFELVRERALADYLISIAELERLTGTTLY